MLDEHPDTYYQIVFDRHSGFRGEVRGRYETLDVLFDILYFDSGTRWISLFKVNDTLKEREEIRKATYTEMKEHRR